MIKKKGIMILLFIITIVLIGYLKGVAMINNDLDCIYVKINDNKWELVINAENSSETIKVSPGDTIYISLLENSTILYEWHIQTGILNGLELTDKYKEIKHNRVGSFINVKEGDNFDRVVFEFYVTKAGDESLTFTYQPKEDTGINDFEKREINLKVQK